MVKRACVLKDGSQSQPPPPITTLLYHDIESIMEHFHHSEEQQSRRFPYHQNARNKMTQRTRLLAKPRINRIILIETREYVLISTLWFSLQSSLLSYPAVLPCRCVRMLQEHRRVHFRDRNTITLLLPADDSGRVARITDDLQNGEKNRHILKMPNRVRYPSSSRMMEMID